jgi:ATP-dependent helicase/nuclease subunit B
MSLLDVLTQGGTVVTPGHRLTRHLRWRYDRAQSASGKVAWASADILSWNAWLERLYAESVDKGGAAGQLDLLTREQTRLIWQSISHDEPGIPIGRGPARLAADAWALCRDWRIPLADLHRADRVSPDTEIFARWAETYADRCRVENWIDAPSLPESLLVDLTRGVIGSDAPVCFAGFGAPTPQQERVMACLQAPIQAPAPFSPTRPQRVNCTNPREERELAAVWARAALEKNPEAIIGIVLPDHAQRCNAWRRTCLDILVPDWRVRSPIDLPVSTGRGEALSTFRVVHTGLLALKLTDQHMDYRDLGQLLRSPYLRGGIEEASGRASLDIWLRNQGRIDIDLHWAAQANEPNRLAPVFVSLLKAVFDWADSETGRHEPGGWAAAIAKLLRAIGWPKGRELKADEHRVLDAWNRLLDVFAACGHVAGSLDRNDARRLLASMAHEQTLLSENRADGVQIMSPEDAIGHTFDGLWIGGMTSDAWPPGARPNPLIPLDLQRRAEIPDATPKRIRQRSVDTMRQLFSVSPDVIISWPGQSERGELVRSPMLGGLDDIDVDSIEKYPGQTTRARLFAERTLEPAAGDSAPGLPPGTATRGGSRLMKLQAACPARAFFESRLGAKEMKIPGFGVNPLERGNIAHDALEHLYEKITALGGLDSVDDSDVRDLVAESCEAALRKHFAGQDAFGRVALRNEENRLRVLVEKLVAYDRTRDSFTVEGTEATVDAVVGPLILKLRQDRVDRVGTGARLVIDYKTGAKFSPNKWRGDRPSEPQLPLYAATSAVEGIAIYSLNDENVEVYGVGATGVGLDFLKGPEIVSDDKPAQWDDVVSRWREAFERLAGEYAGGDIRINRNDTEYADGEFAMLSRIHDPDSEGRE